MFTIHWEEVVYFLGTIIFPLVYLTIFTIHWEEVVYFLGTIIENLDISMLFTIRNHNIRVKKFKNLIILINCELILI